MKSRQVGYRSVGIPALLLGAALLAGCAPAALEVTFPESAPVPSMEDAALATLREARAQLDDADAGNNAATLRRALDIEEDIRPILDHGPKPPSAQRYLVLHDTEGDGAPREVVDYWDRQGKGVGAHFVIGRDGSIVQCVPLDRIAHHAGFGDAGHNVSFGVTDESRDDRRGSEPIGSWAPDYGMNSYSVGIELVHIGNGDGYPKAQLEALDGLIAYLDAYFEAPSTIIDHKAWRSGNSDTSPEFAGYLANYQKTRTHDGKRREEVPEEGSGDMGEIVGRSKRGSSGVFGRGA